MYYYLIIALQVYCLYHLYNNRNAYYWWFIILFLGPIGCVIYLITQVYNKRDAEKITSEITHINENGVIIRASIKNNEGVEVASGYAHEKQGSSFINKTSFIENCETSAWGRCLGNFGIGVNESVASADEVANAINNQ